MPFGPHWSLRRLDAAWLIAIAIAVICACGSCQRVGRAELVDVIPRGMQRAEGERLKAEEAALALNQRTDANAGAETPANLQPSAFRLSPLPFRHEVKQCGNGQCRPIQRWIQGPAQQQPYFQQPQPPRQQPGTTYGQQAGGDCYQRCKTEIQREIKALEERMEGRNADADEKLAARIVALEGLVSKQDGELVQVEQASDGHSTLLGRLDSRINQTEETLGNHAGGLKDLIVAGQKVHERIDALQENGPKAAREVALEAVREKAPGVLTGLLPLLFTGGLPAIGLAVGGLALRSGLKAINNQRRSGQPSATDAAGLGGGSPPAGTF